MTSIEEDQKDAGEEDRIWIWTRYAPSYMETSGLNVLSGIEESRAHSILGVSIPDSPLPEATCRSV